MIRTNVTILLVFIGCVQLYGQAEVDYDAERRTFVLSNPGTYRELQINKEGYVSTEIFALKTGGNFIRPGSSEFTFTINGERVEGGVRGRTFVYRSHRVASANEMRQQLLIELTGKENSIGRGVDVTLHFELYKDSPVIRKWLTITNRRSDPIVLANLSWEVLHLEVAAPSWIPQICTFGDVYAQYGQSVHKPPYIGRTDDAAMVVHDPILRHGFLIGNEAPAILKRTDIYPDSTHVAIGMGLINDKFPFKKTLTPGESFETPKGFIALYQRQVWQDVFEQDLGPFVRKYMGVKLFERSEVPMFLYNTWNPFHTDINDKLIRGIADVISRAGVQYLIIDDGWQDTYGDWNADRKKFPGGLKNTCDYIRSKGMKPGLWISLATVTDTSRIYKAHPEWVVLDRNGKHANLHADVPARCYTMNISSGYYGYIRDKISDLVKTCGLGYIKLDLASVYSSYKLNRVEAGDYAQRTEHRDQPESLFVLYSRMYQLFDELKRSFPDLYIDCTFELYGRTFGIDYSLIQHADGDWLSNIEDATPAGAFYMRQLAFERARIVPASTMLIGNLQMNWKTQQLCYQSLLSATPLMLGDPRALTPAQIQWYRDWSDWAKTLQAKYDFMKYYQTSDIFTKPELHGWDGCARFNPEKNGGILLIYRNESPEASRTFLIPWVNENSRYRLTIGPSGRDAGIFPGHELQKRGLTVRIDEMNSAQVIAIEPVSP